MSAPDWMLLGIVVLSAVFGLMRGFVGVVVSLVAWVLSGWAALRFGGDAAAWLADPSVPTATQVLAGHALAFIAVLVVVSLVGWLVRWVMKSAGLSGIDRMLGLALGLVRGGFVACALVLLFGLTSMPREPEWQASQIVPVLVPGAQVLRGWLPGWVASQVDFGSHEAQGVGVVRPQVGASIPTPRPLSSPPGASRG
ncbi:CvpA family protein [Lysobacter korlensis]|uniref:CvpA family protein n=1 Tax=Lysobacter korlensis TaxID=553636 RepID=A0ABV6RK03_9GAMM